MISEFQGDEGDARFEGGPWNTRSRKRKVTKPRDKRREKREDDEGCQKMAEHPGDVAERRELKSELQAEG